MKYTAMEWIRVQVACQVTGFVPHRASSNNPVFVREAIADGAAARLYFWATRVVR